MPKIINLEPLIGWQLPISSEGKNLDSLEAGNIGNACTIGPQGEASWQNGEPTKPSYGYVDIEMEKYNQSQQSNLRMECLKIAQVLLADHLKDLSLSPRDNSLAILWEVSEKCFEYCTAANP